MQDNIMTLADGRSLGYSDYGASEGVPIFLFHGTPGSRVFGLEGEPIVKTYNLRIIAPERPGYGLSSPQPNREIQNWPADVSELADYLNIRQFHVAGESGGGPYVLACALAMPARIISATLIASAAPVDMPKFYKGMALGNRIGFFAAKYAPFLVKWLMKKFAQYFKKEPEKLLQKMISQFCESDQRLIKNAEGSSKENVLLRHIEEAFRQGNDGHYQDFMLVSRSWYLDFNKLELPVFLWHGESDTLMPISPVKTFATQIPNCEAHFIPGAGHLLLDDETTGKKIVERILMISA